MANSVASYLVRELGLHCLLRHECLSNHSTKTDNQHSLSAEIHRQDNWNNKVFNSYILVSLILAVNVYYEIRNIFIFVYGRGACSKSIGQR